MAEELLAGVERFIAPLPRMNVDGFGIADAQVHAIRGNSARPSPPCAPPSAKAGAATGATIAITTRPSNRCARIRSTSDLSRARRRHRRTARAGRRDEHRDAAEAGPVVSMRARAVVTLLPVLCLLPVAARRMRRRSRRRHPAREPPTCRARSILRTSSAKSRGHARGLYARDRHRRQLRHLRVEPRARGQAPGRQLGL